jgi:hypothetical protein
MVKKEGVSSKKDIMTKTEIELALLNNFVNLQKVLTNLSIKFEDLSNNISKILQLFEISAKSFAEKYSGGMGGESDKEFLRKLDALLDQNKTIAKGIMMMEERVRQRGNKPESSQVNRPSSTEGGGFGSKYGSAEENIPRPTDENRFDGMTRSRPLSKY